MTSFQSGVDPSWGIGDKELDVKSESFRAGRLLSGTGFCGGIDRLDDRDRTAGVDEDAAGIGREGVAVLSSAGIIEKSDSLQLAKSRSESWCIDNLGGAAEKDNVGRELVPICGSSVESSSVDRSRSELDPELSIVGGARLSSASSKGDDALGELL